MMTEETKQTKQMKDAIIEMPDSGICQIDIDKVVELWHEDCFISRYHDEYKLVEVEGVRITISESDAQDILHKLKLSEDSSNIFTHGKTYRLMTEDSSKELKPCPFCGDKEIMFADNGRGGHYVGCSNCNCMLDDDDWTNQQAFDTWNKREEAL